MWWFIGIGIWLALVVLACIFFKGASANSL
jgi:hypothetical protein